MNYQRIHDAIIDRARNRTLHGYREKHHVIPRCLGGTNQNTNLVNLTAREHFIIHKLLCEIYPINIGLIKSYWMMANKISNETQQRDYIVSSREYHQLKETYLKILSLTDKVHRAEEMKVKRRKFFQSLTEALYKLKNTKK